MSYGSSLGITLPTVGVTTGPDYATSINSALTTLINTLEAKVTPSGMDISSDLNFKSGATYSAALNMERATFEEKSTPLAAATYPVSLFVSGGELYFNDDTGNSVQITTSGSVNVSTTGGITGSGYGSSDVEVNWDSGNVVYRMRSGAGVNDFASVALNDVQMNDGSGNTLTVAAPSISSDYTFTLPTAVPASTLLLTMDSSGNLATADTIADLDISDVIHDPLELAIGVEYATAEYDTAANEPGMYHAYSGANRRLYSNDAAAASTRVCAFYIPLAEGERLTQVVVYGNRGSLNGTFTATLYRVTSISGETETSIDSDTTASGTGAASLTLTDGTPTALASGEYYMVFVDTSFATSSSGYMLGCLVTYDRV